MTIEGFGLSDRFCRIVRSWLPTSAVLAAGGVFWLTPVWAGAAGADGAGMAADLTWQNFLQAAPLLAAGLLLVCLVAALAWVFARLFASGLLKVSRMIKTGDLVRFGTHDGRVSAVGWWSTKLETDDGARLFVPNWHLVACPLLNRTPRDRSATVSIPVAASYASDPERVSAVLVSVARANAHVLKEPAPRVTFDGFGPSGYAFTLRAALGDALQPAEAETALRYGIVRAFRVAGLEMPHAQHDVHLRDLDRVWEVVGRVLASRAQPEAGRKGASSDEGVPRKPGGDDAPPLKPSS